MSDRHLTIGTRASPLALAQTAHVMAAFRAAHDWPEAQMTRREIVTVGDQRLEMPLAEIGGKGLFTEELEAGLLNQSLDFAVHSLKDLPTDQPEGLCLAAILPRAAVGDVLVPRRGLRVGDLTDLPQGARIGTSALRRRAQILHARPDLSIFSLRGNVGTRLSKLETENLDAIVLAAAGLARLNLKPQGAVDLSHMLYPAAGQGALAVQCRADDGELIGLLQALHCRDTFICVTAERQFLAALDGSCRTPIAARAEIDGTRLHLVGRLLDDDGTWMHEVEGSQADNKADNKTADQAAALGQRLADELRRKMPKA